MASDTPSNRVLSIGSEDDLLVFAEDSEPESASSVLMWRILIVDDDDQVHAITRFALADVVILGRRLALYHARNAVEVRRILEESSDFAVVMLDVVMEHEQTGLELVRYIRQELKLLDLRIILRTGQPGYAPDIEVMQEYDINDYRTKTELTRNRLVTSLIGAVRTYAQIIRIGRSRRGLEQIVHSAADLMHRRGLESFSTGVLEQIAALVDVPVEGIVCVQRGRGEEYENDLYIVGAAGRYARYMHSRLDSIPSPRIIEAIARCMARHDHVIGEGETTLYLRTGDREGAVYLASARPLTDLDQQLVEVFASNMTTSFQNVVLFERLHDLAYYDALSGLPNRARFVEALEYWYGSSQPWLAILIDIDHFSDINNELGYDVSNLLLRAIAQRLEDALGRTCALARVDGDVFGIVGPAEILDISRLLGLFEEQFLADEHLVPLTVTVGVCASANALPRGLDTFKRAEMALNRAKDSSSIAGVQFYQPQMEEEVGERLRLIRELRNGFDTGQFEVWFQPQFHLETGRLVGFEALLRWRRANGQMVAPDAFVPLAESSGAIVEIGQWVLDRSCAFLQAIDRIGLGQLSVAVNVTVPQFRRIGFVDTVARTLNDHALDPARIKLEITENIVIDEPRIVSVGLDQLRRLGVRLSIDDFGTGFSSLSYLHQLPLDELKVDRSFVRDIETPKGEAIARTIIMLAKQLGMSTMGEGVETEAQARLLRTIGCNEVQGYLYCRPMPQAQLVEWIERTWLPDSRSNAVRSSLL